MAIEGDEGRDDRPAHEAEPSMDAGVSRRDAPGLPRLRLAIVLPGLRAGGTERVVNVLANQWAARGWDVTILTFETPDCVPYYRFHPDVHIRFLGQPPGPQPTRLRALAATARRILALRRALRETNADVAFSFLTRTNVMTLIAARSLGFNVVVSERNNPELQDVGPVWRFLRARLYPKAFGLVTMTGGALQYFSPAMRRRSWVIPNPVEFPEGGVRDRGRNVLTAVGRLVPQKGFDLLLEAFARISGDFPDWKLVIWGEGPERAMLEAERRRLKLEGRVEMPGITPRPGTWVDTADAFVLSSRFEGWGIVLLEAMAADLPVVAFDCQWGPREMILDEENGLLVEPGNIDALAAALRRILADNGLRDRLAQAAGVSARRFTPQRILAHWDEVALAAFQQQQPLTERQPA